MAVSTVLVGPGILDIGETGSLTSLASQVTSCKLVPSVDREDPIPVLSGETVSGDRTESFTLQGTFLQDFGVGDQRISEWSFTNRGKTFPFTYTPNNAADKSISGRITVEATDIGGDVKKKNTTDFEWEVLDPEIIDNGETGE